MTPRQRRIAELIEAKKRIEAQIRLLSGDTPAPTVPVELTPEQIREQAEHIRRRAVRHWRDTPDTIAQRRHDLLVDNALWSDPRNKRAAA